VELVIDASTVFTAIAGTGVTKDIIFLGSITLFAPEYMLEEIAKHTARLAGVAGLTEEEVETVLELIKSRITLVPKEAFDTFLAKANALIPDKDDTEYLALSLSKNNTPIWSNDNHFKKQDIVPVFTTAELVAELKSRALLSE
jgi:predicted nucleic acid-binding protein